MTDVPDLPLEPPMRQSRADGATAASTGPSALRVRWGWCTYADEFTRPDGTEDCGDFYGEPPEFGDDPAWDEIREEGTTYDR